MQTAIAAADAVLANGEATQADIDTAADALASAYKGLAKADASDGGNGEGGNGGGADNGGAAAGTGSGSGEGAGSNGGSAGDSGNGANSIGGSVGAIAGDAGTGSGASSVAGSSGLLTQTGDVAPIAPIVGGGLLAALGAVISAAAMRLRKRNQR